VIIKCVKFDSQIVPDKISSLWNEREKVKYENEQVEALSVGLRFYGIGSERGGF
jgi:hypothetical protein